MEDIKEKKKTKKDYYSKIVEYFRSVRQQNVRMQKTINDLRKRVEFLETLSLNVPEFNLAFDRVTNKNNSDLSKLNEIVKVTTDFYDINAQILLRSKSRKREFTDLRQLIHYLCKKHTDLSLSNIGLNVGGKNHSTVLYSEKMIKDRLSYDKKLESDIEEIELKLIES